MASMHLMGAIIGLSIEEDQPHMDSIVFFFIGRGYHGEIKLVQWCNVI
jgi:hypothetical protein